MYSYSYLEYVNKSNYHVSGDLAFDKASEASSQQQALTEFINYVTFTSKLNTNWAVSVEQHLMLWIPWKLVLLSRLFHEKLIFWYQQEVDITKYEFLPLSYWVKSTSC